MPRRFALLCPGQGAQHPAMFDLAKSHVSTNEWLINEWLPNVANTLGANTSDQGDGISLAQILADPHKLFANQYAQVLIVAASLANWHALQAVLPTPSLVAGYSIGELTAHTVAGRFTMNDAIDLANTRAAAMQTCVDPHQPQGMLALHFMAGATVSSITPLLAAAGLHLAIVNADQRCLIGGHVADLERALPQLQTLAHCTRLPVHIASHTLWMQAAQPILASALQQANWQTSMCPVLAGVDGSRVTTTAQSQQSLLAQLCAPVRWDLCMEQIAEAGIDYALELGPGNALSTMLNEHQPQIACRSVHDFRSVDGIARWLQQMA